jgi:hypothetical protein
VTHSVHRFISDIVLVLGGLGDGASTGGACGGAVDRRKDRMSAEAAGCVWEAAVNEVLLYGLQGGFPNLSQKTRTYKNSKSLARPISVSSCLLFVPVLLENEGSSFESISAFGE